jgi:hypothetical protein
MLKACDRKAPPALGVTQANGQVAEILDPDSRHLTRYCRAGIPSAALQELGTWKSESMVRLCLIRA